MTSLAAGLRLAASASDERFTRIRALISRVLERTDSSIRDRDIDAGASGRHR